MGFLEDMINNTKRSDIINKSSLQLKSRLQENRSTFQECREDHLSLLKERQKRLEEVRIEKKKILKETDALSTKQAVLTAQDKANNDKMEKLEEERQIIQQEMEKLQKRKQRRDTKSAITIAELTQKYATLKTKMRLYRDLTGIYWDYTTESFKGYSQNKRACRIQPFCVQDGNTKGQGTLCNELWDTLDRVSK